MSLDAIGALRSPVRRAVYGYAVARAEPVSRNAVAEALGIGRTLAAFHLDKLAEAGLLETAYAPRSGGPGAGRPAKLYRRSAAEHTVTLPPRDYRLLADVLARVVERVGAEPAAYAAAREQGAQLAGGELTERLEALGYEPAEDADGTMRLRNCPFHALAQAYPPLVCGLNLALLEGLLGDGVRVVRLDPGPTGCCVAIQSKNNMPWHRGCAGRMVDHHLAQLNIATGRSGNATALRPFEPDVIVNLTVWESVEALRGFVYRSAHLEAMRRRREWFLPFDGPYLVLWWIPAGTLPTIAQAGERLDLLRRSGPSPHAFTLREPYPAPDTLAA
jgi:predicted ArsR family transcriptional regulator